MISAHLLLSVFLFGAAPPAIAPEATVLRTLEGKVTEVGQTSGEGELSVVILKLRTGEGDFQIVVAPPGVLSDIGFSVAVGDQVRARVFFDPDLRLAYAQKLLNQSQDLMVRLRTLRHEPLWDAAGNWQGSPAELPTRRAAPERSRTRGDRPAQERPTTPRPPG